MRGRRRGADCTAYRTVVLSGPFRYYYFAVDIGGAACLSAMRGGAACRRFAFSIECARERGGVYTVLYAVRALLLLSYCLYYVTAECLRGTACLSAIGATNGDCALSIVCGCAGEGDCISCCVLYAPYCLYYPAADIWGAACLSTMRGGAASTVVVHFA